jgi:site-specific DNA-methyltransferase (adenine-specific)
LRDYGVDGQGGQQETPEAYIEWLALVFDEVGRVLKPEGTLWVNIGDCYVEKSLLGLPWMLAFALQRRGWLIRQNIIWEKTAAMPEYVKDRFCGCHEDVFFFTKQRRYYFDIEAAREAAVGVRKPSVVNDRGYRHGCKCENVYHYNGVRIKRDVWSVAGEMSRAEGHFARYPERLILPCVVCGCPVGGVVLDPFMGSGTTALVAMKTGRGYVGCEINPDYVALAERRIERERGLFDVGGGGC